LAYAALNIPSGYNINADLTVHQAYGISVGPTLVAQTNNDNLYAVLSNPIFNDNSKTGVVHYNAYFQGTGLNYFGGSMGIGTVPTSTYALQVSGALTATSTSQVGILVNNTLSSAATVIGEMIQVQLNTAAASYTMGTAVGMHIYDA